VKTIQSVVGSASSKSARTLFLMLGCLSLTGPVLSQQPARPLKYGGDPNKLYLEGERSFGVSYTGKPAMVQAIASGQLKPLALAAGDLDGDGVEDLVAGFGSANGGVLVIHRGNLDAFAPQSQASWQAIGEGRFPSPFLSPAKVFELPEAPDFLVIGNFTGEGHLDVAVGARGSRTLYILANDGRGGLLPPQSVTLNGALTALDTIRFDFSTSYSHIVAGISGQTGSQLIVFEGTAGRVKAIATAELRAPATSFAFGSLSGDSFPDAAIVAGGELQIVHGRDVHAARIGEGPATLQAEAVSIPFAAASVAVGSFLQDRASRLQMAVLGTDGSVHIVTRAGLDTRPWSLPELQARRRARMNRQPDPLAIAVDPKEGWQVAESFPAVVSVANPNQPPILFRTRISSRGSDDVMVLDSTLAQVHVISHERVPASGLAASNLPPSFHSTLAMSASSTTVAGIPMRVNIDGRPGVVVLRKGQMEPQVMMPLPDPTFVVNTNADLVSANPNACLDAIAGQCSLREAIIEANNTPGTDTIMLPAGTFTLTIPRNPADHSSSETGTLEVQDSLNIVGAADGSGNPASIVQGGTNLTTSVDKVFSFNEDIDSFTDATVSISNLVIQNGHNRGNTTIFDGWGGAFDFDTGGSGNSTLTVTNCNITTNTLTEGEGGGFAIFNTNNGTGFAQVTNSTIQNNVTAPSGAGIAGNGGGIFVGTPAALVMNNSKVMNNSANANAGVNPVGGGLEIIGPSGAPGQNAIHGSTISGNHADGDGGGIWNTTNLLIDTSSILNGNSAGGNGGGFWHNASNPDAATLTKVTVTGNTATGSGGGIYSGNVSGGVTLTMQFSRLAGNTSAAGTANLNNINTAITATNNWWGTNTPSGTITDSNGGTTTFDPFIVLSNTASPIKIGTNQSSTLTGDMSKDNHGSGAALAGNLDVFNGLAITFHNAILGTIPQTQPEALSAGAQATATFNAGTVGGIGSADATVDQQTVTATITILQPPSITKSFNPTTVQVNTASTLTFGITNGNSVTINSSFTDTLPANLVVATTPAVVNGCNVGGGTVTATAGAGTISFTTTALATGTCTLTVNVQSATDGVFNNNTTIDSADAGNGNTASATLTVIAPPAITKGFGASTVPLNGTTSLTFTVSNSNANSTLSGVAFTDSLPAGLVMATPAGLTSNCSGTATAANGSSSVSLSGATLAPGTSCAIAANVTGTTSGVKNNSVQVGSTNGGTGNTSNASVMVVAAPTLTKSFGAASVPLTGSTSLGFTVQNNSATNAITGVAFSDTLPAGLVVSTPNGLTGTCGAGTVTATADAGTVSLSGGTLAASASCTFSVNVTGTTPGTKNNTTGHVTSIEGGTGGTASASLTVEAPPSIAKAFGAASIPLNGTTSLTFSTSNPTANTAALTGVAFADTLPAGIVVATPNGLTNSCGGTATAVAGSGIVSLTGSTIAVNTTCTLVVNVTGTASGQFTNTTGNVSSTNGGTGNTATANLTVASAPAITKAFGVATIPVSGTTSLTFSLTNPNAGVALTGVAFTDTLPAGLIVATPNNLTSSCGGPVTAVPGSGQVSLSAGTLATSASCAVSISIQGATAGVKNNSVQVTSTEGGTGNTSNASMTVVGAPVITKTFGAASIPLNGSTSLSFTIQNNNTTQVLAGVGFTDTLPAGLVVSTPNGLSGICGGGTVTGTAGTNVVSLSAATLAASASCTFSVNVTGITAGTQNNTTSTVTSTQGGTGGTASASVTVEAPPSIAKAFGASAVPLNGTTSLTLSITNPAANTAAETGVAFTDTLPAGLVVTTPNGLTNTCGGTATATAGSGSVSLSGGTVAVNSTCALVVNVTGTSSGSMTNTTGAVNSTNGGTGNTASANLTVASPPVIAKSFGAAGVAVNSSTSLSFLITNPAANVVSITGLAFTDNLPAGLVVTTPSGLSNTCGGTATATAGSTSVILTGATLAPGASCMVAANVTATSGGVKNNSVTVTSANAGTGNTSTATLTSTSAPSISKSFGATSIPLNGSTSLTFGVQNSNATTALTGVGFADVLPGGLVVSTPNGLTGSCGGGTITAAQGGGAVSLSGANLAASASCTFSVNVTGIVAGTQNNVTGNVTSTEGGAGGTATASISVIAPPSIAKAFSPMAISPNGTSSLSFTITNPAANSVALTGVAFTDTFPTGITIATPNGLASSCAGTITAAAGSGALSLSGGTIAAGANCSFSVNVTGSTPGSFTNTTGAVSSTNGGTGNTATANLTVGTPPSISKSFGAASIGLAASTPLSFTITNSNASIALTGVAFTDPLPAGLVVSTPNGLTGTCGTGIVTAAAGSSSVALTGGTIATTGTCSFSVNVTAMAPGNQVNTTGAVSAANGGTGNTATASITVLTPDLTITKSHAGNFFQGQTGATYTITVNNIGPGPSAGAVSVIDTLPAGLTATGMAGTGWACTVGTLTCTRNDSLASNASYPVITMMVSVAANAAASVTNVVTVSGGGELNTANDSFMDVTTITVPPDFTLAIAPPSIAVKAGQTAQYGITVTPVNNAFMNPIAFTVSGLPGKTSFAFTPSSVTPGATAATSSLNILTTPGDPFLAQNSEKPRLPLYAMFLPITGLVLSGFGFRKRKLGGKWILAVAMFVCAGFTMYGCASAGNFRKLGTPPGTYSVTVTATSGSLQHTDTVTLVVQP
jgi:CSLREA domain-containing protein/uncharacterized repeat protein (TIGR01451 family)